MKTDTEIDSSLTEDSLAVSIDDNKKIHPWRI